jgi:radical SAM-linked protein
MAAHKVRLRFAKRGDLRLVSHHDLLRCVERLLRRSALPMAHSQGFNPRPRIVFPLALALGIEGRREVVELELAEELDPLEVLGRLAAESPPGLDWLEAEAVGPGRPPKVGAARYSLVVPPGRREAARAAIDRLLASDRWPYQRRRPDRTVEADLRPFVLAAALGDDGTLRLRLRVAPDGSARPEEAVEALGLRDLLEAGAVLVRDDVELDIASAAPPEGGRPNTRIEPGPQLEPNNPIASATASERSIA